MVVAIDIDNTWTVDPAAWRAVYEILVSREHQVIIATGRKAWSDDMGRMHLPVNIPIVYCGNEFKEQACRKQGYTVDVWIDDMPGTIQDVKILSFPAKDEEL